MTTKHTHIVVFGRKVADCPRCAELIAGAAPVRWNGLSRAEARYREESDRSAIAAHFAPNGPHSRGACGPVCTFGDW